MTFFLLFWFPISSADLKDPTLNVTLNVCFVPGQMDREKPQQLKLIIY